MKNLLRQGLGILCVVAFFILAIGTSVMLLWNLLMPDLFGLPHITFVQAAGLTVLVRLLTGNWAGRFTKATHWSDKKELYDKWRKMSPEAREKFKQDWRDKCRHQQSLKWKDKAEDAPKD